MLPIAPGTEVVTGLHPGPAGLVALVMCNCVHLPETGNYSGLLVTLGLLTAKGLRHL